MSPESESDRFVRYLLGTLPPEEQQEIEEGCFCAAAVQEELEATADDLIDDYLCDRLSTDERQRFESYFLKSPRQQQRLELVRAVAARVGRAEPQRVRASFWLSAAAVAFLAAGLLFTRSRRVPDAPPRITASTPTPATVRRAAQVVSLPAAAASPVAVLVGSDAEHIRFEVPIENRRHPTFDAVLRSAAGATVWRAKGLALRGRALAVVIPARLIAAADYTLHIEGEALRGPIRPSSVSIEYQLRVSRPHLQSP